MTRLARAAAEALALAAFLTLPFAFGSFLVFPS